MSSDSKVQITFEPQVQRLLDALTQAVAGANRLTAATDKADKSTTELSQTATDAGAAMGSAAPKTQALGDALTRGSKAADGMAHSAGDATQRVVGMDHAMAASNAGAGQMTGSIIKAELALGGLRRAAEGVIDFLRKVTDTTLDIQKAQRTLQFATGDGAAAMVYVRKVSNDLGLELVGTAQAYGKVSAAARGTRLEGEPVKKVFEAIASAGTVMGLSADETSGALLAVGQMISKGTVQAEELRGQLGERLPGAFEAAARAMGVSTVELCKMLEQGKIVANDFLPKFAAEIQKSLGDAPKSASQELQGHLNRAKNAATELLLAIGNAGPMKELAQAAQELGATMDHAAGNGVPREIGNMLAELITISKKAISFVWEFRRVLLSLAEAFVAVKATSMAWKVGEWIASQVAAATAVAANRDATITNALAAAGYTRQVGQSTIAQIAEAQAMTMRNRLALQSAAASGAMSEADALAARESLVLTEAKLAEAAAIASAGTATRGAGVAMSALGGPIGIVLALVGALVFAFTALNRESGKADHYLEEMRKKQIQSASTWKSMTAEVVRLEQSLGTLTPRTEAYGATQKQIEITTRQLLDNYPDLANYLKDEAGHQVTLAEAIKKANDEKIRSLELDIAKKKAVLNGAQDWSQKLEQWNAYGNEELKSHPTSVWVPTEGNGINVQLKHNRNEWELTQKTIELTQGELKGLNDQLAIYNGLKQERATRDTPTPKGDKKRLNLAEIRADIEALRAGSMEKVTLEQKEAAEVAEIRAARDRKLAQIEEKSREKGLTANDRSALDALAVETRTAAINKIENIEIKAAADRKKLEEEVQTALIASEEGGLAERYATVTKHFSRLREQIAQLRQEGKDPGWTEAQILSAENAARERARIAQIEADVRKLNEALARKAELEGRALTVGERKAVIDDYQAKGGTKAAAAQRVGDKEGLNDNPAKGFKRGLGDYIAQGQAALKDWKGMTLRTLQGVENAFATGIQGILSGQMTLGEGLSAIWKGIVATITQQLAQLAAKWIVTAIAAQLFKDTTTESAQTAAVAQQEQAGASLWAAYAGIPFVGPALAVGFIAMMNASLAANAASAGGIVGAAEGGWFDRPTRAVIGEGWQRELVVPEVSFQNYSKNLAANILASERQAQGYRISGARFVGSIAPAGGSRGGGDTIIHVHGHVLDQSGRGLQTLARSNQRASIHSSSRSSYRINANTRTMA